MTHSSLVPLLFSICILYPQLWNLLNWLRSAERLGSLVFAPKDLNLHYYDSVQSLTNQVYRLFFTDSNQSSYFNVLTDRASCYICLCEAVLNSALSMGRCFVNVSLTSPWKRNILLNTGMCSCNVLRATWQCSRDYTLGVGLISILTLKHSCRQVVFF